MSRDELEKEVLDLRMEIRELKGVIRGLQYQIELHRQGKT